MSGNLRKIIEIDEDKCDGCGICLIACHEGAIEIIDGKAKLVSDELCDGLGDCLPECPRGAIVMIERERAPFCDESVQRRRQELAGKEAAPKDGGQTSSEMWPVQLALIPAATERFNGRDVVVAAHCSAFVCPTFQARFGSHAKLIFCPKLDDFDYLDKLAQILSKNTPKSITALRVEVACCGKLVGAVKEAMLEAGIIVPYREITIAETGQILREV